MKSQSSVQIIFQGYAGEFTLPVTEIDLGYTKKYYYAHYKDFEKIRPDDHSTTKICAGQKIVALEVWDDKTHIFSMWT